MAVAKKVRYVPVHSSKSIIGLDVKQQLTCRPPGPPDADGSALPSDPCTSTGCT